MSTPFQNRLVGTIIVAAAVIIFLPGVLDGKKKSNQTDFDAIPKAPTFTGKMTSKPFPKEALPVKDKAIVFNEQPQDELLRNSKIKGTEDNSLNSDDSVTNSNGKKAKVTPATKVKRINTDQVKIAKNNSAISKPILGQQPTKAVSKEAWVIQLGSFKHKTNVAELVDKLKGNGYTVFTKPIKTKQGMLTKVFVGPELIKTSLTKKLPALKKLTNVQGKIARFYPTK